MGEWKQRLWAARLLIGLVLAVNVQCALAFLIEPGRYTAGFELEGAAGSGMVRGMGILFLMWNVPYAVAVSHPVRRRVSLFEAAVMQAIGLVGETVLLATLPEGHAAIRATVARFVAFDGAGLVALLLAIWLLRRLISGAAESHAHKT